MSDDLFGELPPRDQRKKRQDCIRQVLDGIGDGGRYKGSSLCNWYLGAVRVIRAGNRDCVAQSAHSLREVIEKIPLVETKKDYSKDTLQHERMRDTIELVDPLVAHLGDTVIDKKVRELNGLRTKFTDISHHNISSNIDNLKNDIHKLEGLLFDLFAPLTKKNQEEIEKILVLPHRNQQDEEHLISLIEKRGANIAFFFKKITEKKDATWLKLVRDRCYLSNPPPAEQLDNKIISTPIWLPIIYLASVADIEPEEIADIVSQLPVVDNEVVCFKLVEIARTLPIRHSIEIKAKVFEYLENNSVLWRGGEVKLLDYWIENNQIVEALELLEVLVGFTHNDLRKHQRRVSLLEQVHRMDSYFYRQLMKGGVRSLIEKVPYEATSILIKNTAEMFQLGICEEGTYIWQGLGEELINEQQSDEYDSSGHEKTLINTMIFACEKVYEKQPNKIGSIDKVLCNENWDIFRRVRILLYKKYPCEDNKHSIRKLILEYDGYGKFPFDKNFSLMIKSACNYFGKDLLSEQESTKIFAAISKGPSRNDFLKWTLEENPSDEDFQQFKDGICRTQFLPFECLLPKKHADQLRKLKDSYKETPPKRYYSSPDMGVRYPLSDRSSFSSDELAKLTNSELLALINNWEKEIEGYEGKNFITFNIRGLSREFQIFFKDSIVSNQDKLNFWLQNYKNIARPIYIEVILDVANEQMQEGKLDNINKWFDVCDWILLHPNQKRDDGIKGREFRGNPDWSSAWWAVCSFVYMYLCKNNEPSYPIRKRLLAILKVICTQYDSVLDREIDKSSWKPCSDFDDVGKKRDVALLALIHIAYIGKKCHSKAELSTMNEIIEQRLSSQEYPLKPQEYAILGANYPVLYDLDKEWAKEHSSNFFPRSKATEWRAAFKYLVIRSRPCEAMFEIIKDHLGFAIYQLKAVKRDYPQQETMHDALAERIFDLYFHGWGSLKGKNSLLAAYYEKVTSDQYYRGNLLRYVGRYLCDKGDKIDKNAIKRITDFFEWRLEEGDFSSTGYFTPWLCARCLPEKYRLEACLKVLENCELDLSSVDIWLRKFCEILPNQTAMVVECFEKLTYLIRNSNAQYIDNDNANNIISAGMRHTDKTVCTNAKKARENLYSKGLITRYSYG